MMLKTLISILFLLVASAVNAFPITYKSETSTFRKFATLLNENNHYKITVFKQNRGDFQEFVESNVFTNSKEASLWLAKKHPSLKEGKLSKWSLLSDSGKRKSKEFWIVENYWNSEWEQKYASWIEKEVDSEFFYRHKIETDCADIVVGLRWIFARKYKLPAANRLTSTGDLFTQDDVPRKWRKLPRHKNWYSDQLFLRALNFLMNSTTSWSLERDSFPVKLDQEGLIAGRYIINNKNNSWHTRLFSQSDYAENNFIPLYTWASTSPRDRRLLIKEIYLDEGWPTDGSLEILAHKWPIRTRRSWRLARHEEHPDYGPNQFEGDGLEKGEEFYKSLFKRIKPSHSIASLLDFSLEELKNYINQRVDIVEKGASFCSVNDCSEGSFNWDNWSTPSRDRKVEEKFKKYELIFSTYKYEEGDTHQKWIHGLNSTFVFIEGLKLSLSDILYIWESGLYSSDPSVSLEKRWGLNFSDHFISYSQNLKDLFSKREERLSETDCTYGCNSNSGNWWDYHTYHIDAQILKNYSRYHDLCDYYDNSKKCVEDKARIFSQTIKQLDFELSLDEWEKRIPLFNSDPRASIDRKLGLLKDVSTFVFGKFDSLFIAKNSFALLNNMEIVDLISSESVRKAQKGEELLLHSRGQYFSIKNNVLSANVTSGLSELYKFSGKVKSFQNENSFIFYDSSSVIVVDIETLKLSKVSEGVIHSVEDYKDILLIWTSNGGHIIKLDELEKISTLDSFYQGKVDQIYLDDSFIVGQFSYKDEDRYCPFLYKLKDHEFSCLVNGKSKLEFYSKPAKTLAYSVDVDSVKKNIFISSLEKFRLKSSLFLSNFLDHYEVTNDGILLLTDMGSYYEPSGNRTFYKYSFNKLERLDLSAISYFYRDNYFQYSDNELSLLTVSEEVFKLPSRIDFSVQSEDYTKSAGDALIWRLNAGRGDLQGVGGVIFDLFSFESGSEIYPDLSINYGYLELSESRQSRLEEKFHNIDVYSGTVTALGENTILWINK
ncbi:hypothetical protein [Halobacteriovorax sp.]|uniref:hypothetical protein n=1 Tax=Halobacteriovorax sp. TaxID=2020862 RepID=UPI003569A14F